MDSNPQAFFQNGGKIVWDNNVKVSERLSKKEPDLNPKEKLQICVGKVGPALHQLHQEGWVTVDEKLFVKTVLQERVTLNGMC